jgi:hypothetical protein
MHKVSGAREEGGDLAGQPTAIRSAFAILNLGNEGGKDWLTCPGCVAGGPHLGMAERAMQPYSPDCRFPDSRYSSILPVKAARGR